jgi:hypothetical protein
MRIRLWGGAVDMPPPLRDAHYELRVSESLLRSANEEGRITDEFEHGINYPCNLVPVNSRPHRLWRQVETECRAAVGDYEGAARSLGLAVDAGLRDLAWIRRCSALTHLRSRPEYPAMVTTVEARVAPRSAIYLAAALPLFRVPR